MIERPVVLLVMLVALVACSEQGGSAGASSTTSIPSERDQPIADDALTPTERSRPTEDDQTRPAAQEDARENDGRSPLRQLLGVPLDQTELLELQLGVFDQREGFIADCMGALGFDYLPDRRNQQGATAGSQIERQFYGVTDGVIALDAATESGFVNPNIEAIDKLLAPEQEEQTFLADQRCAVETNLDATIVEVEFEIHSKYADEHSDRISLLLDEHRRSG